MAHVLIIGGGPAGCSAALTLRLRGADVTILRAGPSALEKGKRVDNYPGLPQMSGSDMQKNFDEQIREALHTASADFVLDRMEQGLDSDVGEGGGMLSTGEKQLLSIARAILADPRILVLDEATSSVDTVTERAIQDAIAAVIRGRTSFVIAHRLSTIVGADVILAVQDGKILEKGTHRELMMQKGYYYQLFTRQYEESVWSMPGQ